MDLTRELIAFVAGVVIATITTPVGVSGAVFLLPVQLSVLGVPNPQLTPTNLIFNVVSGPGGLVRYARSRRIDWDLTRSLLIGTAPGVVLGALLRVFVIADPDAFRLVAAAVLTPIGLLILLRTGRPRSKPSLRLGPAAISIGASLAGTIGGIYGIGGGSLLGPLLVGAGMAVTRVAPAALASTWITSIIGIGTYVALSFVTTGPIAPDWFLGIAAGLGGLLGGWLGATLQPRVPEMALRIMLALAALSLAGLYVTQVVL